MVRYTFPDEKYPCSSGRGIRSGGIGLFPNDQVFRYAPEFCGIGDFERYQFVFARCERVALFGVRGEQFGLLLPVSIRVRFRRSADVNADLSKSPSMMLLVLKSPLPSTMRASLSCFISAMQNQTTLSWLSCSSIVVFWLAVTSFNPAMSLLSSSTVPASSSISMFFGTARSEAIRSVRLSGSFLPADV